MPRRGKAAALAALLALAAAPRARAQVDPERRRLLQFGVDKNLSGPGPTGAYLFYYMNQPKFVRDDLTLRVALAPVYIDSELGIKRVAPQTDAAVGLAGGGYAESYSEVRRGEYIREESFTGHGAAATASLYPRLSPESWQLPVNLILRAGAHAAWYVPQSRTDEKFVLPPDHVDYRFRAGLRLGGEPPELMAHRAAELSFWYEGYLRDRHGGYGFDSDRTLEQRTHQGWARLRVSWKFESHRQFQLTGEGGLSSHADRIDAYRVGGMLPFASEFALALPGYYNGELTARRYALFGGDYFMPFERYPMFSSHYFAQAANVTYLPGLEQGDTWNEGLGLGLAMDARGGILRVETNYAYGVDAIRSGHRGAHSVSIVAQLDLQALTRHTKPHRGPISRPTKPEGMEWLNQLMHP